VDAKQGIRFYRRASMLKGKEYVRNLSPDGMRLAREI